MAKHLILIHGRDFKPSENEIKDHWLTTVRHGLVRDHGKTAGTAFDSLTKHFVYYAKSRTYS